jgi:hypothetical protein
MTTTVEAKVNTTIWNDGLTIQIAVPDDALLPLVEKRLRQQIQKYDLDIASVRKLDEAYQLIASWINHNE